MTNVASYTVQNSSPISNLLYILVMLADVSGEEVEAWMLANKIVTPNDREADAPTNQPCAHEPPASAPLNFVR